MRFLKYVAFFLLTALVSLLAASCEDGSLLNSQAEQETKNHGNHTDSDAPSTLKVILTDAPDDFEAVYIDIREIKIRKADNVKADSADADTTDHSEERWITVSTDSQRVDLLKLRNGDTLTLGEAEIEAGHYDQIRLILGSDNEVIANGQSHYLKTPSARQSGLKLKIDADIEAGATYSLLVDFDASRSIVRAGNKRSPAGIKYLLKPVLRAVNLQSTGSVSGAVEPADVSTRVYTVANEDTIATITDSDGTFQILGLAEGSYNFTFEADSATFRDTTLTDIQVFSGENTDIGTVALPEDSDE